MVDFSNPATQQRITPTGLIGANVLPTYTPAPIDMSFINNAPNKPAADHINPNKLLEEERARQQEQLDLQKEQFAAQQKMANEQLALGYYQYALAMKNSNKKSGKIICTEFYAKGFMSKEIYEADQCYGDIVEALDPDLMEWYHKNAPWWVNKMRGKTWSSLLFTRILWLFVKPWAEEMAFRMAVLPEGNRFGAWLMDSAREWVHKKDCRQWH